jgi:FtsP/CotA-like multicopper oxidase with cupredoxin domain
MKKFALIAVAVFAMSSCADATTTDTTSVPTTVSTNSSDEMNTETFTLTVGENSGAENVVSFTKGSNVELTIVNPNADDEVHLHGYDLTTGDLPKGEKAVISFIANEAGDFEIESHISEEVLSIIRISE